MLCSVCVLVCVSFRFVVQYDLCSYHCCTVPYKWWKDAVLATLGLCSVVFVIFALRDRKMNKIKTEQLKALMKTAEDNLATLQQRITLVYCCSEWVC